MAANSAQHSAPVMVMVPASTHATSNHPGEPTRRDDSADTIKIPDPIMEPTTIIVASTKPSDRVRAGRCSRAPVVSVTSLPAAHVTGPGRASTAEEDYGNRETAPG